MDKLGMRQMEVDVMRGDIFSEIYMLFEQVAGKNTARSAMKLIVVKLNHLPEFDDP
jgi:hypothetical protein